MLTTNYNNELFFNCIIEIICGREICTDSTSLRFSSLNVLVYSLPFSYLHATFIIF